MVQTLFGIREAKNGTETDKLQQTGTDGHKKIQHNDEENPNFSRKDFSQPKRLEDGRVPAKEAKKIEDRRTK